METGGFKVWCAGPLPLVQVNMDGWPRPGGRSSLLHARVINGPAMATVRKLVDFWHYNMGTDIIFIRQTPVARAQARAKQALDKPRGPVMFPWETRGWQGKSCQMKATPGARLQVPQGSRRGSRPHRNDSE
ncbi:hypothetical protein GCM10007387_27190 [Pseudoduganella albidiflava]|uniref:Uncharacterized protein n=1 Tax=Pseudoduganella albidiflava TaxID=321983 RepID=A0AA87XXM1_9BURK|nr:hypothetical protein GCM10007387_27190 [Pseudoduganella albidiflava]